VAASKPDVEPKNNPSAPSASLQLEWIHGLKSDDVRAHVYVDGRGRVVFPAAAVLVALDADAQQQSFFFGPTDEITCVAQDPTDPNIFAVGQNAALVNKRSTNPFVSVFDVSAPSGSQAACRLPQLHQKGISALAYSPDGALLASCGRDADFTIIVWDVRGKRASVAQEKALNREAVMHLAWNPVAPNEFCCVGKNTVGFYSVQGAKLVAQQARFDPKYDRQQVFGCVAYTEKGVAVVGTKGGAVYAFLDRVCAKVFRDVHSGPITAIRIHQGAVITAGPGQVRVNNNKLDRLATFETGSVRLTLTQCELTPLRVLLRVP
jgi:microtubule-associated protein-like 6